MLSAKRKSDGQTVNAYSASRNEGPFACLVCSEAVVLRAGRSRINHFAHENPIACKFASGETDEHRRCKQAIYEALKRSSQVEDAELERALGEVRPDVFARIRGVSVAIEVQISSLSLETITSRTIEYARKGIYVLWLLPWTSELDRPRYAPSNWERWIHATYFGRVYYWIEDLKVVPYRFESDFVSVPRRSWYGPGGSRQVGGGYSRASTRYRRPARGKQLDLVADFAPCTRYWKDAGGLRLPDARLFTQDLEGRRGRATA
jgi:competence protein CoiA